MNWLKSYFSSSTLERRGIVALLVLLFVLVLAYMNLPYLINAPKPQTDPALTAAFRDYIAQQPTRNNYGLLDRFDTTNLANAALFPFDPNTLDSTGFLRLGLRPKTVRMLLNWRRKGKIFYKKEDLKPLYTLKQKEYETLEPYINITSVSRHSRYAPFQQAPLPDKIDLNTTDSATIVRLNGIGPTLAHKIIKQRNALGGFVKHEQLAEIYRFPDTTFGMLRQRLVIDLQKVKRFKLNAVSLEELKAHPYLGDEVAKNIIIFRDGLKRYDNIEQLRQVPLMNEEIYRKIAPYFIID